MGDFGRKANSWHGVYLNNGFCSQPYIKDVHLTDQNISLKLGGVNQLNNHLVSVHRLPCLDVNRNDNSSKWSHQSGHFQLLYSFIQGSLCNIYLQSSLCSSYLQLLKFYLPGTNVTFYPCLYLGQVILCFL
ncbi:hypothetical protein ES703_118245 [subsurface metagenome]